MIWNFLFNLGDLMLDEEFEAVARSAYGRREALRCAIGFGALAAAAPLLSASLAGKAQAFPSMGVAPEDSNIVFISADKAETVPMAEWEQKATGADELVSPLRFAAGADNVAKAPADASRYEAKTYQFPTGSIRVLRWKKGGPVLHQITFETEIYVHQGSLTLTPLYGFNDPPVKIVAGDALFYRAGVFRNLEPTEDTVLITFIVSDAKQDPSGSIVSMKDVPLAPTAQWQVDGKEFSVNTPEEYAKAPPDAARFESRRYNGDGNSFRVAHFRKGGKTNMATPSRSDTLIYLISGRMMRHEGKEVFEMKAGDATRECLHNPGMWEVPEDAVFIATDAPFNPANFSPDMVPPKA
jgi:quercetin dioxygenase-like cupin family protein